MHKEVEFKYQSAGNRAINHHVKKLYPDSSRNHPHEVTSCQLKHTDICSQGYHCLFPQILSKYEKGILERKEGILEGLWEGISECLITCVYVAF